MENLMKKVYPGYFVAKIPDNRRKEFNLDSNLILDKGTKRDRINEYTVSGKELEVIQLSEGLQLVEIGDLVIIAHMRHVQQVTLPDETIVLLIRESDILGTI